jgi:iduronate 2-sulfatase
MIQHVGRCLAAVAMATLAMAGTAAEPSAAAGRVNVLLVCVDDLKPAIGCYGDALAKTPNIDRLAARGVRFERAYCNQAVCSPSRNALLTGFRPQSLGIYDLATNFRRAAPTVRTLPQLFRDGGFHASALGKIFHVGHGNHDDEARFEGRSPEKLPRGSATESARVDDEAYDDGRIAAEAVRRIRSAATTPGKPFFLAVGFLRPHLPFVAPERYWDLHDPDALPRPDTTVAPIGAPPYASSDWGELRQYKDAPDNGPVDEALARRLVHGYYAAASFMDAQVGKLLDALDDTGLAADTIVVLWGDHGWHLGDHGLWCKHTNYEQATRIPLIVSAPGMHRGATTAALVESVDILPTLLDLAGLPAVDGRDGRSFARSLADPSVPARDHCIQVYPRGKRLGRAIRTADLRLCEWREFGAAPDQAEIELYDMAHDPGETKNVAADRLEDVARLRALLAEHPEPRPPLVGPAADRSPKRPLRGVAR